MTKNLLTFIVNVLLAMNLFSNPNDRLQEYNAFQEAVYTPIEADSGSSEPLKGDDLDIFNKRNLETYSAVLREEDAKSEEKANEKAEAAGSVPAVFSINEFYDSKLRDALNMAPKLDLSNKGVVERNMNIATLANHNDNNPALAKIDTNGLRLLTNSKNSGDLFNYFKKAVGGAESNYNYSDLNKSAKSGAWGKYQFIKSYHLPKIRKVTGVASMEDFLHNHNAQEQYFKWYYNNELIPGLNRMRQAGIGDNYSDIELLGAIHFQGEAGAKKMINNGDVHSATKNNPSLTKYLARLLTYGNA